MTLDPKKLSGTGCSPSHIGKANVAALVAATEVGQPTTGEPPDPAVGGWVMFIADGSGIPPRNTLVCKYRDFTGRVTTVPVGAIPGPGVPG